jgi:hypothetical protein
MDTSVLVAAVGAGCTLVGALGSRLLMNRSEEKKNAADLALDLVRALQAEMERLKAEMGELRTRHQDDIAALKREHEAQVRLLRQQLDDANAAYHTQVVANADLKQKVAELDRRSPG